eukprot:451930-Amphidinium_carterae.1
MHEARVNYTLSGVEGCGHMSWESSCVCIKVLGQPMRMSIQFQSQNFQHILRMCNTNVDGRQKVRNADTPQQTIRPLTVLTYHPPSLQIGSMIVPLKS